MTIKEVTLKKNFKIGLPNFSNEDIGIEITWEVGGKEEFDFNKGWDIVNQQMEMQVKTTDPSWIKVDEYRNKYKATISIPK